MHLHDDPAAMIPDERRREIAGILAAGFLRLRNRAALPADPAHSPDAKNLPNSSAAGLEVPSETRLSVPMG